MGCCGCGCFLSVWRNARKTHRRNQLGFETARSEIRSWVSGPATQALMAIDQQMAKKLGESKILAVPSPKAGGTVQLRGEWI
jgi:hypothetical protein